MADIVQFDPLLRDLDLKLVSHGAQLDAELIRQNWPTATKITSQTAADQWYLGDQDRRAALPGENDQRHFVIAFDHP